MAHLGAGRDGFHRPAVQGDELQSGGQDSSLELLLRLVLLALLSALVLVTVHGHANRLSISRVIDQDCAVSVCVCVASDRPGVWPGGLFGCSAFMRSCCCVVLFGRVSLVVLVEGRGRRGRRRFVGFKVVLKPRRCAVEASAQAAALRSCCCRCSHHCREQHSHEHQQNMDIHGQKHTRYSVFYSCNSTNDSLMNSNPADHYQNRQHCGNIQVSART